MTREELERNWEWTSKALTSTDGQGRPIVMKGNVQEIPVLPKDKYGQVLMEDNVDETLVKAYTGIPAFKKITPRSMFADQPVVNAMTGF